MNKTIQKWRWIRHGNISIRRNLNIDTELFTDTQIMLPPSEDDLHYSEYSLNDVAAEFSMEINTAEN
jgi:hypothetical protein